MLRRPTTELEAATLYRDGSATPPHLPIVAVVCEADAHTVRRRRLRHVRRLLVCCTAPVVNRVIPYNEISPLPCHATPRAAQLPANTQPAIASGSV
jgi:hypothetical protein